MKVKTSTGVTLIELVIAIVVIGIGLTALLATIIQTTTSSADPMVQQQANAVAQTYMEEVLAEPFCDWNDLATTDCFSACTASACTSCTGSTTPGGGGEIRASYDDVCDFDGINEAASDINGAISELSDYNVTVTITDSGTMLNGLDAGNGEVVQIDVEVTHAGGFVTTLTSFKVNY